RRGGWAIVEWNDTRLVNHLVDDCHVAGSLYNLVRIAVNGGHHRTRQTTRDASIIQAPVFPGIRRTTSVIASCRSTRRCALRGLRRKRRNLAIGWIDDQPSLAALRHIQIRLPPSVRGVKRSLEVFNRSLLCLTLY